MSALLVCDLSAIALRTFYSLAGSDGSAGPDPSYPWLADAVTGAVSAEMTSHGITHLVFALDSRPSWRHRLDPTYKAGRGPKPAAFAPQWELLLDALDARGLAMLEAPDYEADDVIATVALAGIDSFERVYAMSNDHDLLVLAGDGVTVLLGSMKINEYVPWAARDVAEEYGFPAAAIPEYKAIAGDASDNYPGCPGIGETGATALIAQYGSVEGIYAALDELPERTRRLLVEGRASVEHCRRLAYPCDDVPLSFSWSSLATDRRAVA